MKEFFKKRALPFFACLILGITTSIVDPAFPETIKLKRDQVHSIMGYVGDEINISVIIGSTGMMEENGKYILVPAPACMVIIVVDKELITELRRRLNMKPLDPTADDISEAANFLMLAEVNVKGKVMDFIDLFEKKEAEKESRESKFIAVVVSRNEDFKLISLEKRLHKKMVTRIVLVDSDNAPIYDSPDPLKRKIIKSANPKVPLVVYGSQDDWFEVFEDYALGKEGKVRGWIEGKYLSCKDSEFPELYKPQPRTPKIYGLQ